MCKHERWQKEIIMVLTDNKLHSKPFFLDATEDTDILKDSKSVDFFDQTQWRTDYFELSPEKFKNVIWDS